ncbi:MAG: hypothetical protein L0I62_04275 [Gammaproteobacteria bacterium]|nr:hypothetical protein [Gammaproteobacteria bacterium]
MTTLAILRALHVVGVVWWIGGVAIATCVILPMVRRFPPEERLQRIKQFEHRFAVQARIAVLIVGITGFWMLAELGGIARLTAPGAWWLDLMILVWLIFALLLFIAEPLGLPAKVGLIQSPFGFQMLHTVMLILALAAVFAGVLGVHGGL